VTADRYGGITSNDTNGGLLQFAAYIQQDNIPTGIALVGTYRQGYERNTPHNVYQLLNKERQPVNINGWVTESLAVVSGDSNLYPQAFTAQVLNGVFGDIFPPPTFDYSGTLTLDQTFTVYTTNATYNLQQGFQQVITITNGYVNVTTTPYYVH